MATTKKPKQIQTPVDERETFVSLQKNFASGEVSVQDKLRTLYKLQQADNAIEQLVQLRGELPAEVAALEDDLAALQAKYAHIEELIAGYGARIEAEKKQIVEIDADIAKYQQQLNNISNSREFDSINKELENQGLLRQISEKNISEAIAAIEARKEDLEALSAKIAIRQEDLDAKKVELDTIVESTSKEEAEIREKRDALAAQIDERTLSAYNRIKDSVHNHLAVVSVCNENSCGGCFNTITPQRLIDIATGNKLIICEHCGRIIVNPEI
ncbi:MAG: hypothetical protein J5764_02480 [Bacteroidales bacterium]|nr:hypothetical protein [Bacteroidales bacterium]